MASTVCFWDLRAGLKSSYEVKLRRLLKTVKATADISPGDLTAFKIHFGEQGASGFVSPLFLKPLISYYKKAGARPFLTDTNTLYAGQRGESVSHAMQAHEHGFDPLLVGAPVIIADGIKSANEVEVPFAGKHFDRAYLAGDMVRADALVSITHFKGHALVGFGGVVKNLGMGGATRRGKMQQHRLVGPHVNADKCRGCGTCVSVCRAGALSLDDDGKVAFNPELCVGCAACLISCRHGCLGIDWKTDVAAFQERVAEYAAALVSTIKKPCLHISFVTAVSSVCDCVGYSDVPLCPDIGVFASFDPVAVDAACLDAVNRARPNPNSPLHPDIAPGEDKLTALYPKVDPRHILRYSEHIGLGSREYKLAPVK